MQPPFAFDESFYGKLRTAKAQYKLVEKFDVAPFSGRGLDVKKGQTFRFVTVEGPQIGDVTLWNSHNVEEYFAASRTWVMED